MPAHEGFRLVALAGVPNVGKSTIFNAITGLNQKVGNYPGITVDKKTGVFKSAGKSIEIIDLPGTYNIYPRSEDEEVVFRVLCGMEDRARPDAVLAVADMSNLDRGLFLALQLIDLGYPTALVLNMEDQALREGFGINKILLERLLGVPVYITSADRGQGIDTLKKAISEGAFTVGKRSLDVEKVCSPELLRALRVTTGMDMDYRNLQMLKFRKESDQLQTPLRDSLESIAVQFHFDSISAQRVETETRYTHVRELLAKCVVSERAEGLKGTLKLDRILLHRYWGMGIFMLLLFLMFQAIFTWAQIPMEGIEWFFAMLGFEIARLLPEGALNDLLSEGIVPGLGGIVVFVPQIALLFAFLALLEGSGYMARAVFITDKAMRPFGLSGRSVVPLISGFACAIPAIMATRGIADRKDRIITIFVTPFMSCSARLPVYIVLIGLIIPEGNETLIDQRGMALFAMYLLGVAAALASAWVMKVFMKTERRGSLVLELPRYRIPSLKGVMLTMYEKSKTFVLEAGRVILGISVVLWVLASYGPGNAMEQAAASVPAPADTTSAELHTYQVAINTARLESSYAGRIGHFIEPVIRPLGFDWKIGIALVTSFAAREVFVATINTLYSIGADDQDYTTIQERLAKVKSAGTDTPFFSAPMVWSLLVFYAFAMQCMSTVAVVHRETKGWKWPLIQTAFMTLLAYFSSLGVYQFLS